MRPAVECCAVLMQVRDKSCFKVECFSLSSQNVCNERRRKLYRKGHIVSRDWMGAQGNEKLLWILQGVLDVNASFFSATALAQLEMLVRPKECSGLRRETWADEANMCTRNALVWSGNGNFFGALWVGRWSASGLNHIGRASRFPERPPGFILAHGRIWNKALEHIAERRHENEMFIIIKNCTRDATRSVTYISTFILQDVIAKHITIAKIKVLNFVTTYIK